MNPQFKSFLSICSLIELGFIVAIALLVLIVGGPWWLVPLVGIPTGSLSMFGCLFLLAHDEGITVKEGLFGK